MRFRKLKCAAGSLLMAAILFVVPLSAPLAAQDAATLNNAAPDNAAHARKLLEQMKQALGGDLWLHMPNSEWWGTTAEFFHGTPNGIRTQFWYFHQAPDQDRWEFTKHRDDVQLIGPTQGWEITYRGLHALPKEQVEDALRRRAHSLETVMRLWFPDARTLLTYDGQQLAERHLADQVTLLSADNDSVTLQLDAQTHLPLRRIFRWRDPVYKDKNQEVEEYDNYRVVDGIATPYSITEYHNGEMTRELFLLGAEYDRSLPADEFDPQATARRIVK